jgi:hypothetical protein
MATRVAVVALCIAAFAATAAAQNYATETIDRYFRVEWQTGPGKRGPIISGYVHNIYNYAADRVLLRVERLDGAGKVVSSGTLWVVGQVPPDSRAYFEGPVPDGAATYRVRVEGFDLVGRGGGA